MNNIWKILFILRLISTVIPQFGYVHPDEFFQSIEVVAGDILNLKVHTPWELTKTRDQLPIRSMVIPYTIFGIPLWILKKLSEISAHVFNYYIISPYLLLVTCRLIMTSFSVVGDVCVYQICKMYHPHFAKCLWMYASSFVTLVFMTRTLSNAIEALLFAVLLLLVTCSLKRSETIDKGEQHTCECYWIALVVTAGIFNRPTFVFYATVPVLFWLRTNCFQVQTIIGKMLKLLPCMVLFSVLFIIGDTLYFGGMNFGPWDYESILHLDLIVAPLNFILYNLDNNNLMQHGLHPKYLHILVNLPLLFGLFGISVSIAFVKVVISYLVQRKHHSETPIDHLMMWSFVMPVILLSVFPHQEPRFLIPLLLPLVILNGDKMFKSGRLSKVFLNAWIIWNIFGCLFYGYLHQAGVIPSLLHISNNHSATQCENLHVLFFHTYMPPRFLLLNHRVQGECEHEIHIYDLMGASLESLKTEMDTLSNLHKSFFVVMPASLQDRAGCLLDSYKVELKRSYWHISMEDPPTLTSFLSCFGLNVYFVQSGFSKSSDELNFCHL